MKDKECIYLTVCDGDFSRCVFNCDSCKYGSGTNIDADCTGINKVNCSCQIDRWEPKDEE